MNEFDYDNDLSAQIERVLAQFISEASQEIIQTSPNFIPGIDALSEFVFRGGKRLRPTFAWWAWRGVGGEPTDKHVEGVVQAIASLELLQACALIHDDLMDSSDSRRGAPTVHIAFAKRHANHGWAGLPSTFGLAAAVLIGDLALAWADDMISDAAVPPSTLVAARPVWRAMRTEVLAGQYLDVETQASGDSSTEAAIRIARLKTAAYTVQRPLHLGAALAGAKEETVRHLIDLGSDLGIAFQLRDDLLGVFGDPSVTGKPAGDDLKEGKRTLLVALGLQLAQEKGRTAEAALITEALGNPGLTNAEVERVRQIFHDVGAVDGVEKQITELTARSLNTLRQANLTDLATDRLTELAVKATQRTF